MVELKEQRIKLLKPLILTMLAYYALELIIKVVSMIFQKNENNQG